MSLKYLKPEPSFEKKNENQSLSGTLIKKKKTSTVTLYRTVSIKTVPVPDLNIYTIHLLPAPSNQVSMTCLEVQ